MKDKFSYIIPPSPTMPTTIVGNYHPTSNWQNGAWGYEDLSYLLHDPALNLPVEKSSLSVSGDTSSAPKVSTPKSPSRNVKVEPSTKYGLIALGVIVAGAIGYGYYLFGNELKLKSKLKSI